MGQAGLLGLSDHLRRLLTDGDLLEELVRVIEFEPLPDADGGAGLKGRSERRSVAPLAWLRPRGGPQPTRAATLCRDGEDSGLNIGSLMTPSISPRSVRWRRLCVQRTTGLARLQYQLGATISEWLAGLDY